MNFCVFSAFYSSIGLKVAKKKIRLFVVFGPHFPFICGGPGGGVMNFSLKFFSHNERSPHYCDLNLQKISKMETIPPEKSLPVEISEGISPSKKKTQKLEMT